MKLKHLTPFAFAILAACATAKSAEQEPSDPDMAAFRARERAQAIADMMRNFQRVHFEFDSALITTATQNALAANVDIMQRFPEIQLEIQGHCDETGATEYNLALGERRAHSMKKYMATAGVVPDRIKTISYGEEQPLADGHDVETLAMNRRAEFRVTVGRHPVVHGTVASGESEATEDDASIAQR